MQEATPKKPKNEDLEVTGISRSGRVRKKSSKLMDFESPDDIEAKYRRQTPVRPNYPILRPESENHDYITKEYGHVPDRHNKSMDGDNSGTESDFYDNNAENQESMGSDSSDSFEERERTPAHSLYMMEKSAKKKLIVKDGRVVGRAKAQRKDKGKPRVTAYMLWAKDARNDLLRKHPEMDFSAVSKRLGEMWGNVSYNERYQWKRKAKKLAQQKEGAGGGGRAAPPAPPPQHHAPPSHHHTPHQQSGGGREPRNSGGSGGGSGGGGGGDGGVYRVPGCGALEVSAHLRLLGENLTIIGERLLEHEGQITVSGSVSVLLDTLLCSLAPLVCVTRAIPAIAPPASLLADTLDNIAYIMPGL